MMAAKGRPIFGSLWFRLVGAFAAVIAVMLLVVALVTRGVTEREFDQYLTQRDALFVDVLASELTSFYEEQGSWDDVQEVFVLPPPAPLDVSVVVDQSPANEESQPAYQQGMGRGPRWQESGGDHDYENGPRQYGV